jgi:hypothetical protein
MNRLDALLQLERLRFKQLDAMVIAVSEVDRQDLQRNVLALERALRALQVLADDSPQNRHRAFKPIKRAVEATPEEIGPAVPFPRETYKRIRSAEIEDIAGRRWIEKRTGRSEDGHLGRYQAQNELPDPQEPQLSLF